MTYYFFAETKVYRIDLTAKPVKIFTINVQKITIPSRITVLFLTRKIKKTFHADSKYKRALHFTGAQESLYSVIFLLESLIVVISVVGNRSMWELQRKTETNRSYSL